MADKKRKMLTEERGGFFYSLTTRIKLILRLMADRRVNPFLKLLPIGTLVYFFVPDLVLGPIDDGLIIWLGAYLFIELCPPEIVQEHMNTLNQVFSDEMHDAQATQGEVIDAEFWEKKE